MGIPHNNNIDPVINNNILFVTDFFRYAVTNFLVMGMGGFTRRTGWSEAHSFFQEGP